MLVIEKPRTAANIQYRSSFANETVEAESSIECITLKGEVKATKCFTATSDESITQARFIYTFPKTGVMLPRLLACQFKAVLNAALEATSMIGSSFEQQHEIIVLDSFRVSPVSPHNVNSCKKSRSSSAMLFYLIASMLQ